MAGARRAATAAQKEARARVILDAAAGRFDAAGFDAARVEEIAAAAGVAKGTVFLYYPTKESLALAVLGERVSGWLGDFTARLEHLWRPASPESVAAVLRRSVEDREAALALLSELARLEAAADAEAAGRFRESLREAATLAGRELERCLEFVHAREGTEVVLAIVAVVIGVRQISRGDPRISFPGAVGRTVRIQLEGLRAVRE